MRIGDLEQLTKFHDKLNPDLWENNRLKPEVRLALFKIAKAFIEFINIPDLQLTDVTISGSNASYNYNANSDIDLHLVADVNGPCEADLDQLFMAKKGAFNDQHDINIYGHSVEVYVQRSDEKHISNGIYSVYNDNWVKFPKTIVAKPDTTNIEDKFEHLHAEIEQAIESGDRSTIKRLKERIAKIRKSGLAREGEYGVENLTFKLLRNEGDLDKLNDAHLQAVDNDLSLDEGFSNAMSTNDMIAYLRQHHDTNLHQDYLNHLNTFSKFVLKNIPVNSLDIELGGLEKEKVERYKNMDFTKAPPIVIGDGHILDGYHRANAAKALGITTIKAYVGVKGNSNVAEGNAFLGALNTARKNNLDYFIVDGKKYKVKKSMQKIQEAWTKKYKKSINCSHPKGFSQKAHCAGRRKRQAGGKTKSKSVS
jgi:hypothetical protein